MGSHDSGLHHSKLSAYELLERGGYLSALAPGVYAWQPLGFQVLRNIGLLLQREMRDLGGQEVLLPILNPSEAWELTGRRRLAEERLLNVNGADDLTMVLAPSHEIAAMLMFRASVHESSQLPSVVFQLQGKIRNEQHPGLGLDRTREFIMQDAYSLHVSFSDLNNFVPHVFKSFQRIFRHLGLDVIVADGSTGQLGSERCFDFFLPHSMGDHGLVRCQACNYEANMDIATGTRTMPTGNPLPSQTVVRPDIDDMDKLARTIGVPESRVLRSRLFRGPDGFILAVFRADQTPSVEKIGKVTGAVALKPATAAELRNLGLSTRFLGPANLPQNRRKGQEIKVIVDRAAAESPNLLMPLNEEHTYQINANFGRDFDADIVGDIVRIDSSFCCIECGGPLQIRRAWKLASIARVGNSYSKALHFSVSDSHGKPIYPHLGAYGINPGRLLLAIVESNRGSRGFCWPSDLGPARACLIAAGWSPRVGDLCRTIHERNTDLLLWDDRDVPVWEKFQSADRMGLALRIVVSRKSLSDGTVGLLDASPGTLPNERHVRIPLSELRGLVMERVKRDRLDHS